MRSDFARTAASIPREFSELRLLMKGGEGSENRPRRLFIYPPLRWGLCIRWSLHAEHLRYPVSVNRVDQ